MNKEEYVTKEYLNKTLDERFSQQEKVIKQHMTDLTSGFKEQIKGVSDQVKSVDERLTKSISKLQDDVTLIKEVLTEKTDVSETRKLEKRVSRLETKFA